MDELKLIKEKLDDIYSKLDFITKYLIVAEVAHERFNLEQQYIDKNIHQILGNTNRL